MKSAKSVVLLLITTFFISLIMPGCAVFRKKNQCEDCPKWSNKNQDNQFLENPKNTAFLVLHQKIKRPIFEL